MVGIVVVSHSAKIAEGICELAGQMAAAGQRLIAAGGMADGSIGTDAVRIRAAIEAADTGDGVLVMVDLGSAVISAELAIDMLGATDKARVAIADAPILEGTIAAAVDASIGQSLAGVLVTAEAARNLQKL
ncbi:dihydroxyacetone kinase phosphoryl donor subunit DhaM [Sporomusa sphaeroides]|uniref:phosphoenolpyruvate--glycerone phosphotransferase n=1 Tax=Sporomusa sphaeroides DSM 2875 TaxID=1337886 RepID=A0ABM9W0U7_9FIRM|nr:dihydroxyacetone kinase phosphoryl donor subunit DhaM [Sporomusa sphaeroides]OLS56431.1 PTS-dependent dihydroxyacetone kinase, phosphotransferase subunit DhaM [Sporomusa sphaeroides DSM 2875]CVK18526.1 PTS-dependent dihydroxyacetone kinase, phosphotransferase subunit DhaM [Sporomusa sphaeroides DSM 2875]